MSVALPPPSFHRRAGSGESFLALSETLSSSGGRGGRPKLFKSRAAAYKKAHYHATLEFTV